MSKEKPSWDDIPSIEGLEVDYDYTPESLEGKRRYVRMEINELTYMFEVTEIVVIIADESRQIKGKMNDLSQSGISVIIPKQLTKDQHVKLGFMLGRKKIVSNGLVRHARTMGSEYLVGIEFIDMEVSMKGCIAETYAAKVLEKSHKM